MRDIKMMGSIVLAALALAGAASAATWDPQGTVVPGHGTLTFATGSLTLTCTSSVSFKATGDLAQTTNPAGTPAGPTFSNCTNGLGGTTHVTANAAWNATATTTTTVDVTNFNLTFNLTSGVCVITASGVSIPNNVWSNALHRLTASSASSWPITRHGFCPLTGTTMTFSGSFAFSPGLVVT